MTAKTYTGWVAIQLVVEQPATDTERRRTAVWESSARPFPASTSPIEYSGPSASEHLQAIPDERYRPSRRECRDRRRRPPGDLTST